MTLRRDNDMMQAIRESPERVALLSATALLCALAIGVPTAGVIMSLRADPLAATAPPVIHVFTIRAASLLARSVAIASIIALLATLLAFPAAWSMRRLGDRAVAILLAPTLLPGYLVYASWGYLRAPGTWLGDRIADNAPTLAPIATAFQAIAGLSLWAWPIAAIILTVGARRLDTDTLDALRLGGASPLRKAVVILTSMKASVLGALFIVTMLMLGSAIPLHVAQIQTYAITIWRLLDETAGSSAVWRAALPMLVIAILAGTLLTRRLTGAAETTVINNAARDEHVRSAWLVGAFIIWSLATIIPLTLFLLSLRSWRSLAMFWPLSGQAIAHSAVVAASVAALSLLVAVGSCLGFSSPRSSIARKAASLCLGLWIIGALTPGVLIGFAIQKMASGDATAWIADTSAGVTLAHLTRFGAVAAIAGWWLASSEPRPLIEQRRLFGPESLRHWLRAEAPAQAPALLASAIAVAILSFHEIESAVILTPPGNENFARMLLDQLHYLRMDELAAAGAYLMAGAVALSLLVALLAGRSARALRSISMLLAVAILAIPLIGCGNSAPESSAPIHTIATFGEVGASPGQFIYPRAIDSDGEALWIIDKTARVQRLTPDGSPTGGWVMPDFSTGFPVGVTCGPDGLVYIADTHQHRVLIYQPIETKHQGAKQWTGKQVASFGSYGDGPGQFYYVTDVAIVPEQDGVTPRRIYVSEYGGNDRISVFNADYEFLFSFGEFGSGASADPVQFNRPQSILYDAQTNELLVADAANHRVGRFTLEGKLLTWIGAPGPQPGAAPGEFNHPYGLATLPDGSLLVAEFGASRIQRINLDTNRSVAIYGQPGRGDGQLAYPWSIAVIGDVAFALDSGNNRVLAFRPGRARSSLQTVAPAHRATQTYSEGNSP